MGTHTYVGVPELCNIWSQKIRTQNQPISTQLLIPPSTLQVCRPCFKSAAHNTMVQQLWPTTVTNNCDQQLWPRQLEAQTSPLKTSLQLNRYNQIQDIQLQPAQHHFIHQCFLFNSTKRQYKHYEYKLSVLDKLCSKKETSVIDGRVGKKPFCERGVTRHCGSACKLSVCNTRRSRIIVLVV